MPIASSMAEAIVAPTAVMPLSPAPLMPSGLSGLGASSRQDDVDVGRLARGRHQVVRERDAQRIAALAVGEFLQQRAAQCLA